MAISEDKKRLFTTEKDGKKIGISLWEIMACLGYYKRDTNGRRNLGMIIKNAAINDESLMKPYRSSVSANDINERRKTKYGWDVKPKSTSETMASFLDKLKANGDGNKYWGYLRPRGGNTEWYRALDFDGYEHLQKAYGTKSQIKRITPYTLGLQGNVQNLTLKKNANTYGTFASNPFTGYSSIVVRVKVEKVNPPANSAYNWDVEGTFAINVVSDSAIKASETWDIYSESNDVPTQVFEFRYDIRSEMGCTIQYVWNIDNHSYIGESGEPFDIGLKVTTEVAYTLAISSQGREGIRYIGEGTWNYDTLSAVFGEGTSDILVVELTDGNSIERKMARSRGVVADVIFSSAGFSQSMIQNYTTMYLYMMRGNAVAIFGADADYADISKANGHVLVPYQRPYNDITYKSTIPEFEFYADDFDSIVYTFSDGTSKTYAGLTSNGVNCTDTKDVEEFIFKQNVYFENVTKSHNVAMRIEVYTSGKYEDASEQTMLITESGSVSFEVDGVGAGNPPQDLSIVVQLVVDGDIYYLHPYTQVISTEKYEPYPLGI